MLAKSCLPRQCGSNSVYTLDGSKIVAESRSGTMIYYTYDDKGTIMGMIYNGQDYIFSKNLQGDVIGIYNSSRQLVAKYEYSAYGRIISITNGSGVDVSNNASHIANINPFRYRGYYYDTETGFYYLQSRYYDPIVGRFLNADVFVSTGQGIIGNNMFAYCGNNPVMRADPAGCFFEFLKNAFTEIGKAMGAMSPAYAGFGGVAVIDGPLPFGDAVAAIGITVLTIGAIGIGVHEATRAPSISIPKVEEKEDVLPEPPPIIETTYYHVTTPEAAEAIMASGFMVGSRWEGGYIYAWRTKPNKYAIRNSGAHFGVIISFKTRAPFVMDTGISDVKVQKYGPVVSVLPGPIAVWDVQIVG